MALRWEDVDLAQGVIRVERSYDEKARVEIEPKSRAGKRTVPIVGALRDELLAHKARERRDAGLVFGSTETKPFVTSTSGAEPRSPGAMRASTRSASTRHGTRSPQH